MTRKAGALDDGKGKFSFCLLFSKITGFQVTILGIMMGAPFWFDMRNKIFNGCGTGAKPAMSSIEEVKKKK
jgi:hypothetical protein